MKNILLISALFFCFVSRASVLDKIISITLENATILDALVELEEVSGVSFSYQPSLFDTARKFSLDEKNVRLASVLEKLLSQDAVSFYSVGAQVVLYRKTKSEKAQKKIAVAAAIESKVQVYDTVWTYLEVRDTQRILFVDTLTVFDTISIPLVSETPQSAEIKKHVYYFEPFVSAGVSVDSYADYGEFNTSVSVTNSWAGETGCLFYSEAGAFRFGFGASLSQLHSDYQVDARYYSVDSNQVVDIRQYEREKIVKEYKYVEINGYIIDTVLYDTIVILETSKKYKTDSIFFSHQFQNKFTFFSIPVFAGYSLFKFAKISCFAVGGLNFDILLHSKGGLIELNKLPQIRLDDEVRKFRLYALRPMVKVDIGYQLSKQLRLSAGLAAQKRYYSASVLKVNEPSFISLHMGLAIGL